MCVCVCVFSFGSRCRLGSTDTADKILYSGQPANTNTSELLTSRCYIEWLKTMLFECCYAHSLSAVLDVQKVTVLKSCFECLLL